MTSARVITCKACGNDGKHGGHDLCNACYKRWDRAGRPDKVPPPPTAAPLVLANQVRSERAKVRREDYAFLRESGEIREVAARRVGITERTARWYEADLQKAVAV